MKQTEMPKDTMYKDTEIPQKEVELKNTAALKVAAAPKKTEHILEAVLTYVTAPMTEQTEGILNFLRK